MGEETSFDETYTYGFSDSSFDDDDDDIEIKDATYQSFSIDELTEKMDRIIDDVASTTNVITLISYVCGQNII